MHLEKWQRKRLRHMRRIVVDGKLYRWCIMKTQVGYFSEYTPGTEEVTLFLRGVSLPLCSYRVDDIDELKSGTEAIGPGQVAKFIKRIVAE